MSQPDSISARIRPESAEWNNTGIHCSALAAWRRHRLPRLTSTRHSRRYPRPPTPWPSSDNESDATDMRGQAASEMPVSEPPGPILIYGFGHNADKPW